MPENVSEIEIHFKYSPILETNKESIRKAVVREGLQESVIQEDTTVKKFTNCFNQ